MFSYGDKVKIIRNNGIGYIIKFGEYKNKRICKVFYLEKPPACFTPETENFYEDELEIISKHGLFKDDNFIELINSVSKSSEDTTIDFCVGQDVCCISSFPYFNTWVEENEIFNISNELDDVFILSRNDTNIYVPKSDIDDNFSIIG